ncbi:phosphate acyltransferase [Desulfovibrio inopinatus]|uniref:phosphate acyltransferase n=1 Tax=Desulfovibrio inopinatus TaxID=102109 RepID=UPI0003FFF43F|nr:phosphate acyltransferase [Desulfovibrio inopinatus]
MHITCLDDLITACAGLPEMPRVAVVNPVDGFVLRAAVESMQRNVAIPVFVGDLTTAKAKAKDIGLDIDGFQFYDEPDTGNALRFALRLYRQGEVGLMMKGLVPTADLLKAVLDKETGAPPQGVLSHVALFERPMTHQLMILTDAGVNIRPNLQRKVDIVKNAVTVMRAIGVSRPKIAFLAATEKVNYPAMPATLDADLLTKMAEHGEFGEVDAAGPMALDIAVSHEAAQIKGITNSVAGSADILVVPAIESGNVLYKSLNSFNKVPIAGIVAGSAVPLVVPSRGDSEATKLHSLALAACLTKPETLQAL